MPQVRAATFGDIGEIVELALRIQENKQAHVNHPVNKENFAEYIYACISSPGIYVFIAENEDRICALLILNEFACPWNRHFVWATDSMFISEAGGPKLVRLAKRMKKAKKWDKLFLSTTTSNPRADKFYEHFGTRVGSVFEIN